MGRWVFDALGRAAVRRDPNEAELFKTEQASEGEYAGNDALVREIIQNSLDARVGSEPVRVRLAIHENSDAPVGIRRVDYFARLRAPLVARGIEFNALGWPIIPCRFLVCEDFGTRGLEGDVTRFDDPPLDHPTREDFCWFWRNIGRSAKTGDDLGRWGLGKTVYRAVSRVGCMFGLTVRRSDRKSLLMGQAVLQIHSHEGKQYRPEGYWCSQQDESGLPLPIEDAEEIRRFSAEWRLVRTTEPGLSVVAPFVREELKPERILQAVAVHFFSRILSGDLVVEVAARELGTVTLNHASIEAECQRMTWDGTRKTKRHSPPPIAFVRRCLSKPPVVATTVMGFERLPEWNDKAFTSDTDLAQLRREFAENKLIAVRVRIWLPQLRQAGSIGQCDVFVQQHKEPTRVDSYFVREGMTITKINATAGARGVQAFVNVEPGPLAKLLGDTEGPAHEDWDTSADRPDREWRTWKGRVRFVRSIVDGLVHLLTPPIEGPDIDSLSDFFSITDTRGPRRDSLTKAGGDEADFAGVSTIPKWFQLTARPGGFAISRDRQVVVPTNARLRISLAYDIPRGNPLNHYSTLDFVLSKTSGAYRPAFRDTNCTLIAGNVFELTHIGENFTLSLDGFDLDRDLFVRVDDMTDVEEESA